MVIRGVMTRRVFEGIKRFQGQRARGSHSRAIRRWDLVGAMNARGLDPVPPETLHSLKRLRSPSRPSEFERLWDDALKTKRKKLQEQKLRAKAAAKAARAKKAAKKLLKPKKRKSKPRPRPVVRKE